MIPNLDLLWKAVRMSYGPSMIALGPGIALFVWAAIAVTDNYFSDADHHLWQLQIITSSIKTWLALSQIALKFYNRIKRSPEQDGLFNFQF